MNRNLNCEKSYFLVLIFLFVRKYIKNIALMYTSLL